MLEVFIHSFAINERNETGSVVLNDCPGQDCLCGARISVPRQYSTSLWYEVICVSRGAIGVTLPLCMLLAERYVMGLNSLFMYIKYIA